MDKDLRFLGNPYFDEIMIFMTRIPTSQDKYKQFKCLNCNESELYQSYSKANKTGFIQTIKEALKENSNPEWPFDKNILVQFSVSDEPNRIGEIDLDNLAKTLMDALKGTLFIDDNQVVALAGTKGVVKDIRGCIVSIRNLERDENPEFQQHIYCLSDKDLWFKERNQKKLQGRQTRFNLYIDDNNKV